MIRLGSLLTISAMTAVVGGGAARAQPLSTDEAATLRAQVASLKAQLAIMERRLDAATGEAAMTTAPASPTAPPVVPAPAVSGTDAPTAIAWKGSPQFTSAGRSFKVKGRIQADAGYVSHPDGLSDRGLGFASEMRRLRLGGEGAFGGGIGYKLEFELSDNVIDLVDTFITYETPSWKFTVGNHNPFWSLDELTGDTTGSFTERAAFTDAFAFERRLGVSAQYHRGPWLAQGGVFTDDPTAVSNSSDGPAGGDENNSFSVDQRLVYAPKLGDVQLHLAASGHLRELKRTADNLTRYRQRPYLHSTNTRLLSTPALAVDEELNYGVEFAAIAGPWYAAAEGNWLRAQRRTQADVTFSGAYAEVGYFLTGETRAYKDGIFGRTAPKTDLSHGGAGAWQIALRYDRLDLNDADVRGGRQDALFAALVWTPVDNLRLNLNGGALDLDGATATAAGRTHYRIYVSGVRIELDF